MTVIIFFTVLSIASSLLTATFIALPLYLFFRKNGILIQPYPELTECNFEDFEDFEAAPTTLQHSPLTKGRKEEGSPITDQEQWLDNTLIPAATANLTTFGQRLKCVLKLNNNTITFWADKLETHRNAIHYWNSGRSEPKIEYLQTIAQETNCDLNWLITGKSYQQTKESKPCPN